MKEGWEKRKGKRKGKGEDMPNWAPEQSEQPEQFLVTPVLLPNTSVDRADGAWFVSNRGRYVLYGSHAQNTQSVH